MRILFIRSRLSERTCVKNFPIAFVTIEGASGVVTVTSREWRSRFRPEHYRNEEKPMSLKVSQNYGMRDADVLAFGLSVVSKMTDNPHFPTPPVDLAVLHADLEKFSTAIIESLDGSKRGIAEK